VFPTEKYRLTRKRIVETLEVPPAAFVEPEEPDRDILEVVHTESYLQDFLEVRMTPATVSSELPVTPEIVRWFQLAVEGSIAATRLAIDRGGAMHIGGGFHHAFADHAAGFCYLNDTAVAARVALGEGARPPLSRKVERISVVDVDVHQGNGTARIFQDDSRVFTFSIHQENNYPVKERSDLDIGLPDRMEDEEYLQELEPGLDASVRSLKPDLVYYVAGADPYRGDQLGGLSLSLDGLRERDRRVFGACREVGANVAVMLAGGYAIDLQDTVRIHTQTAEEMLAVWPWEG
jgi:acetoin utilization deacetylase AcuC-like enzyme